MRSELSQAKDNIDLTQRAKSTVDRELKDLQTQLKESQLEASNAKNKEQQLQQEVSLLREEVEKSEAVIESMNERYSKSSQNSAEKLEDSRVLKDQIKEGKEIIEFKNNEIKILKEQLTLLEKSREDLSRSGSIFQQKAESLEEENKD